MAATPKLCDQWQFLWFVKCYRWERSHVDLWMCWTVGFEDFQAILCWDMKNRLRPNDPEVGSELLLRAFFVGRKWMYRSLPPTHGPFYFLYTVFSGDIVTRQTTVSFEKMENLCSFQKKAWWSQLVWWSQLKGKPSPVLFAEAGCMKVTFLHSIPVATSSSWGSIEHSTILCSLAILTSIHASNTCRLYTDSLASLWTHCLH